jgi:hypothetical protein
VLLAVRTGRRHRFAARAEAAAAALDKAGFVRVDVERAETRPSPCALVSGRRPAT